MTTARPSTALRRFVAVAIVLPVVLALTAIVIQLIVLPQVPAVIAIHWGATGAPDGFAPSWMQPLMTVAFALLLPLGLALSSLQGMRRGDRGGSYRMMGALAAALATLMSVLFTWTLALQVGLTDARDAPSAVPALLIGFAAAVGVGLVAWWVQPKEAPLHTTTPAPGMALAEGERAAWFGIASMAPWAAVAIGAACVLLGAGTVVSWLLSPDVVVTVVLTVVTVVLTLAALTTVVFRVRVDGDGLTVRSVAGVPVFRVPLAEIRAVAVSDVNPIGEFGGFGIRSMPRRFGVVLRRGAAIEVERMAGTRFVVTVDDAQTGAALLQALAARAGSGRA